MENNLKDQHYKNMGIMLQMDTLAFIAESVAYTVCQHYGIDTSDYSFSYVAGWSEGKEMPELKASLDTIRRAASEMISTIDEKLEVIVAQKTQEQVEEQPESVTDDKVDRKAQLQELLKSTAEQLSPEAKKPEDKQQVEAKEQAEEKPVKKKSVKKQITEKKEKAERTAKPKKTNTKNLGEAI